MSRKLILIDGNSLVYRAFYALPTTLTLPSGQPTNAVYGFTSMLIRLLIDEKPDAVAVAFDSRGKTWRHTRYELYKAHREAAPDELHAQFPLVKDVLGSLAIPLFEVKGQEADDILATLAAQARAAGDNVLVVTGDRDAFQLIKDDHVRVMTTRRGITDIVIYDRDKVIERYGVTPEQVPDFLGLKGDSSDNIPGVPGVGEKTAAKLIQEFGTLEKIYSHLDKISGAKLRESLSAHLDQAKMSKELAILNEDVPLKTDLSRTKLGQWREENVRDVFSKLQFRTLLERFEKNLARTPKPPLPTFIIDIIGAGDTDPLAWLGARESVATVGLDIVWDAEEKIDGIAIAVLKKKKFEALVIKTGDLRADDLKKVNDWLSAKDRTKSIYDIKAKINQSASTGLSLAGDFFDPLIAAYLLAPSDLSYELQNLLQKYLGLNLPTEDSLELRPKTSQADQNRRTRPKAPDARLTKSEVRERMRDYVTEQRTRKTPQTRFSTALLVEQASARAVAALALMAPLKKALSAEALQSVFKEIELPLTRVLARMEACGVGLDKELLSRRSKKMQTDLNKVAGKIYKLAGEQFNINSPQQVAGVLFDKLGLTPGRKTKTKAGYATDAAVLAKLVDKHDIVPLLLEYRELAKLKSTYLDALPKMINPATGRLHTSFNQAVTATGRLSSSNPNLQNIPTRTELGREIRRAFIPTHVDEKLLSADYSQIELRLLAHLSGDEALRKAFKKNIDIHTATAAEVFGVSSAKVTSQMRRHAKAINFGIIYGMSPFGLSEQLGISADEAGDYIKKYLSRYPAVRLYLDKTVQDARKLGYVTTIVGRKRYMKELKSANYNERSFGERVAANAPLQGSAADIIKIAMINIDSYLTESGLQTRMVLQVHDELVFEVPPLEEGLVTPKIKELMENAYPISVPLSVKVSLGRNWAEVDKTSEE